MKGKLLILIGGVLIFLKLKNLIFIENVWIASFFFISFVLTYLSIRNKNRDIRTPRPVYFVGGSS